MTVILTNCEYKLALNDSEILVMQTIVMKFSEQEALVWIHNHQPSTQKKMQVRTYYRIKGRLSSITDKRKFDLQKQGLWSQHIERIDQLETILKFSWQNYHMAQTAIQKQRILDSIVAIQPLLSAYYSASQEVVEHDATKNIQDTGHLSNVPN
tara:strand:- start:9194 stop:9652 length:459 start_codon:yes stop_codon:yes gene_type:complete